MGTETTITVRGVDLEVWKEFQKLIIDKYGNLYGYIGPELTRAIAQWLEKSKSEPPKFSYEQFVLKPDVPHFLDRRGMKSLRDLILEAMTRLGGEATIQSVHSYILQKYGAVNPNSIATSMSDLADNGPVSSPYRADMKIVHRVARGRYRLIRNEVEPE